MAFAKWHSTITNLQGNVIPHAYVTVRDETTGALAVLYGDREGAIGLGNPFQADSEGLASFHVRGGAYHIAASFQGSGREWRYVGIGTAQELDAGAYGAAIGWDATELTQDGLNKHSSAVTGFRVLIIDTGDQRAAVYEKIANSWSPPIYLTGTQGKDGVPVRLSIGTVAAGDTPSATITGESPDQVLNIVLVPGPVGDVTPAALAAQTGAEKAESNAAASDRSAAQHAADAEASQMLADQQVAFARDWAQASVDELVDDGEHQGFSAWHWAEKARENAGSGVKSVNGHSEAEVHLTAADVGAATTEQGELAETAVQPEDLNTYYTKQEIDQLLNDYAKNVNPQFTGTVNIDGDLMASGDIGANVS
ncbi:hypothetical protein P8H26_00090 [Pseudochrobactrum sp. sp1633]|uniref:hypothetical protein n=1 Tax=Pseudochrobactrum sp. sp1633 TaxID=3036706 RepID=UPI0025A55A6B|nr:hypothetical protein [Pseudochrobactrum sp. sp1633]MDM8343794.1 hypothetical protein [Pseudochrobactrum sp. sp1633]